MSGEGASGALRGWRVSGSTMLGQIRHVRMGIADPRHVGGPRSGVQLAEEHVGARSPVAAGHLRAGIIEVAKDDGLRRTGLLAGGLERAHGPARHPRLDALPLDALDAIGT